MTREEAKAVFLNRGYIEVDNGTYYSPDKWRESCRVISEWLEQEPSKDMEEIEEVINCDADAEIKLKMISNIVHSKSHYFKTSRENKIIDEHYWKGFSNGIRTAEWRATKQEPAYCDRNICIKNEYNGVGCDECEVTKSQEPCEDAISRQVVLNTISELNAISFYEAQEDSKECYYEIRQTIKDLPSVKLQEPKTGHWIILKDEYGDVHEAVCSNCDSNGNHKWSYCPNCGADMRGEKV